MRPIDPDFARALWAEYFKRLDIANRAQRCQHIKTNGLPCRSPAMRGRRLCFYHQQFEGLRPRRTLPSLEDADGVQAAIMHICRLILEDRIEHKTAALLLYGLQTASANLKRKPVSPPPWEVVLDRFGTTAEDAYPDPPPKRRPAPASPPTEVAG